MDPGRVRGRGRRADRQPRPARRGLRRRARARRCSSARSTATSSTRARSSRSEYVLPAIKANADYGDGYPLFTALGRPLIAKLAVEYARQTRLRHDRPRLHGQGQRPGAHRGDGRHPRARAQGDRPGALVADGPRRGDRVRAQARHPGQGRHRERAVLDRRQPLGPLLARASGSRTSPTRPTTTSSSSSPGPSSRRTRPQVVELTFEAGVPVALNGERLALVELIERIAEIGMRHGVGIVDHIEDRIVGLKVRDIYEVPAAAIILKAHRELERLTGTIHQNQFKPRPGPEVGLPRLRGPVVGAAARRPRGLHRPRQRARDGHDRAASSSRATSASSRARARTRSTTRSSRRSPSPAACSPSTPRPASSSCGRCSRGWRTGSRRDDG